MRVNASRWESLALAFSFSLILGEVAIVIRISTIDELRVLSQGQWIALFLGVVVIPVGVAGYGVVSARPVVLSRAGAMAFVAAFFMGPAGFFPAAAGILWVVLAGRRGSPFVIDGRMLAVSAIWIGAFLVPLVVHDDPVCVERGITVCTSDIVVWWEAILGLSLGGLAALVALGGRHGVTPSSEDEDASDGAGQLRSPNSDLSC